jgi:hypothetical protein
MLPMLITLPGPGGGEHPAIDVEITQPHSESKAADPATTSALPSPTSIAVPQSAEIAPDDMPQQAAVPQAPSRTGIEALTPEPLAPAAVSALPLKLSPPEDLRQVILPPDDDTTASIMPVESEPTVETLDAAEESSAPAPAADAQERDRGPQPALVSADPTEATPLQQGSPAEAATDTETAKPAPVTDPAVPAAPAPRAARETKPQGQPHIRAQAKGETKPTPAIARKQRAAATAKRGHSRHVVRRRPAAPVDQGIMSLFTLKPTPSTVPTGRRPLANQQ